VSIAGQVTDALTGDPIAGALVQIVEGPPAFQSRRNTLSRDPNWRGRAKRMDRTYTRPDGQYVFAGLPPGTYRLRVSAPPPKGMYGEVELARVTVWEKGSPQERVRLDAADAALPPTRIHGQITQRNGRTPISGATVRLRGDTNVEQSDAEGHYALTHLVAKKPTIEVTAARMRTFRQPIELTPGQDHQVDVRLLPE
jgi:hypothetical protein